MGQGGSEFTVGRVPSPGAGVCSPNGTRLSAPAPGTHPVIATFRAALNKGF